MKDVFLKTENAEQEKDYRVSTGDKKAISRLHPDDTPENDGKQRKNVIIFASGNGSNFEAIIKYFREKGANIDFELVCDKENANVLNRTERLNIRAFRVDFEKLYDFLSAHLKSKEKMGKTVDLFVLAGFMRILPKKILDFGTFINIHPSLLPEFKGKNAIERAFEANVEETGVTIHFADENLDSGKIIEQRKISAKGLSLRVLEEKIHKIEHEIYPKVIENLLYKKRVMVLGGGAREHAIAEKISQSPFLDKLYLAGANDGFCKLGENIEYKDDFDLCEKATENGIDLLVVGPENPLCKGIADIFRNKNIAVIGANKDWARLEGSKLFAKKFMERNGIKTAKYTSISVGDKDLATKIIEKSKIPPVIKADGLALGKGVLVPKTKDEAKKAAFEFLGGKFGEASKTILLEERLFGREISVISLWDGKKLVSFPPACDYKRLLDNDEGENTGGMGSFAPTKISDNGKKELREYLKRLEAALIKEKADFTGVIYSGLILSEGRIYVLEYNMRFGDPETQSILELLENDLLGIFLKTANGELSDCDLFFKDETAYCIVAAEKGYPSSPEKGNPIEFGKNYGCKIYFAGVKKAPDDEKRLITNGGRVLSIVNSGKDALSKIYRAIEELKYDGKIYRKDIGKNRE